MSSANAQFAGMVQVTCTNGTFTVGWDNSNSFFQGKGNIAALYCDIVQHTGYVSDNLSDPTLRWYGGVILDTPTATVETQSVVSEPVSETPTSASDSSTVSTPAADTGTQTVTPDTQTSTVESQTATVASESQTAPSIDTQTSTSETSTLTSQQETSTTQVQTPLPTPDPVVIPEPVVVASPQPVPQPTPEIPPTPSEPTVPSDSSTVVVDPVTEEVPLEVGQSTPTVEEQQPVEEQPESPVEEEQPQNPDEPSLEEPTSQVPQPEPEPSVIPEPTSQPETSFDTPMVTLDNGVIIPEDVAQALEVLDNPAELLADLFTDPGQVLLALSNIGADMSPQAREKSKKAVVQAVIVGSIVTQAAGAAYRRKP